MAVPRYPNLDREQACSTRFLEKQVWGSLASTDGYNTPQDRIQGTGKTLFLEASYWPRKRVSLAFGVSALSGDW
jgi:hypothetical protein